MMMKQIFVNIAVKDLQRSIKFFTGLGFTFNPQFTDDKAACMIIEENIFVMMLIEEFFQGFTKKEIVNPSKSTEAIIAISADSREAVDKMVKQAIASGGSESKQVQDHGWMYQHGFQDPDGHLWEVLFADVSKLGGEQPK